jgi:hypothetical protein
MRRAWPWAFGRGDLHKHYAYTASPRDALPAVEACSRVAIRYPDRFKETVRDRPIGCQWRVTKRGEFYRKSGIPSCRELPARRFDEAARFLTDGYQVLTGEGLPF